MTDERTVWARAPETSAVPSVPGARVAVRLVPGLERRAGRDFYDVLALDGGRLALTVGHLPVLPDPVVSGSAVERLRGALAMELLHGSGPTRALLALHRFAEVLPELRGTTLTMVLFDPATAIVQSACAGSPAPLAVGPGGVVRQLVGDRSGPLGVGALPGTPAATVYPALAAREVLLLHTVGAARRCPGGGSPARRLANLVARLPGADPEALCERMAERIGRQPVGLGGLGAVLLAVTPEPPPPTLTVTFPARPGRLPGVRDELRRWLAEIGAGEDDAQGVEQAVGEAAANAVEHAYPDGQDGLVRVTGSVERDGTIQVAVADGGRWRPPRADPGLRGRGLLLMQECVDRVVVDPSPAGTTVTLRRTPRREGPAGGEELEAEPESFSLDVRSQPGRVVVRGELPERTGPTLRRALLHAARGGALPVLVDLTGVGEVSDGAVRALFDVAEAASAVGQRLTVLAPAGSSVAEAVSLAGLHQIADVVASGRGSAEAWATAAQSAVDQTGPAQIGPAQIGPAQIGPAQIGTAQIGAAQPSVAQPSAAQTAASAVASGQSAPGPAAFGPADDSPTAERRWRERVGRDGAGRAGGPGPSSSTVDSAADATTDGTDDPDSAATEG
ncbi:STAS domain-containing protein [Streptoalloteichus hindustanus]|uniref:STAS domain-containing protein n=1 Tax=Streptoalloteichus hindustanus TaxID=2017 RepID=A0A1M5AI52_STRHI|nr:ATP-binding protein [Streptoalloteichus hindustanus]SHF29825.1 STAS domain-containing protein [Streptoalloteichus hindustanus]